MENYRTDRDISRPAAFGVEGTAPQDEEVVRMASQKKMGTLLSSASLVMADTCSILHDAFPQAMEHMLPYLTQQKKPFYVPVSCVYELKKLARDPKRPESFRQKAAGRLHLLAWMKDEGVVDVLGEPTDGGFADSILFSQITTLRHRVDSILLITNDYKLGEDVQRNTVADGGRINVCQINRYGYFSFIGPLSQQNRCSQNPFRMSY